MVIVVTIEVLHVATTARTLALTSCSCIVTLVIPEIQVRESLLQTVLLCIGRKVVVSPEVRIYIAWHHDGCLTTVVRIYTVCWIIFRRYTEGFHQIDRWTAPTAPAVTILIETFWSQVALEGVLRSPLSTYCPAPCNQNFVAELVRATEDVLVVLHQSSA